MFTRLVNLLKVIKNGFEYSWTCSAYTKCGKGNAKFVKFQLEWYRQCSFMLQESSVDTDTLAKSQLCDVTRLWWAFRADHMQQLPCTLFHSNAVMIAIHSAVYNFLTSKVAVVAPSQTSNDSGKRYETLLVEPDDVYY